MIVGMYFACQFLTWKSKATFISDACENLPKDEIIMNEGISEEDARTLSSLMCDTLVAVLNPPNKELKMMDAI